MLYKANTYNIPSSDFGIKDRLPDSWKTEEGDAKLLDAKLALMCEMPDSLRKRYRLTIQTVPRNNKELAVVLVDRVTGKTILVGYISSDLEEPLGEIPEDFFPEYSVGDIGPAGGIVFYDKGKYSDGWRYLEAAPEDLKVGGTANFIFGYYRTSSSGSNLYVNGSTSYTVGTSNPNDGRGTGTAIGTGKANTEKLVKAMGSAAYIGSSGPRTTNKYAAKLADDYVYGGYGDWFLPSRDELKLMYTNLHKAGLGSFASGYYWSSSEDGYFGDYAWRQFFGNGYLGSLNRYYYVGVRCVRAF